MFILICRFATPISFETKVVAAAEQAVKECQVYFEEKVWPDIQERGVDQDMVVVYKPEITLTLQILEISCLHEEDNGEVVPERVLENVFGSGEAGTVW
jgi:hypothetical protein